MSDCWVRLLQKLGKGKIGQSGNCNSTQLLKRLTDKLRSAEDVFKIVAKVNLVCQAEVDELNAWVRHAPIQQHDVFRLETERKKKCSSELNDERCRKRNGKDKVQRVRDRAGKG